MKTIFTLHAGEVLTGTKIEQYFKNKLKIWIPNRDDGIDLLLTDMDNNKVSTLQVKFSKSFMETHINEALRKDLRACGWWTLSRDKILNSKADFWVFALFSFKSGKDGFIILTPKELLNIFNKTDRQGKSIHCYFWITDNNKAFETRGLGKTELEFILQGKYDNSVRDVSPYLNNWNRISKAIN